MLFSCKISHSVLTFLDRHGEDLGSLYDNGDWPAELLRDPTYWLEADKMESLLEHLTANFGHAVPEGALAFEVGRQAAELRSWGALDSVLRLVQAPKDLYSQPERILSYFISPAPPIGNMKREADSVHFELPLDASEYPLVVQYLRAAFESLPAYMGRPLASAQWNGSEVSIRWTDDQESLFEGEPHGGGQTQVNPALVRSVLQNLEESQRRLEEAKTHLARKNEELDSLRSQLRAAQSRAARPSPRQERLAIESDVESDAGSELSPQTALLPPVPQRIRPVALDQDQAEDFSQAVTSALDQVYRLGDYLGRAQQLVTILVGQGRANPQVQEAMRRVDWPTVQANAPLAAKAIVSALQAMRDEFANCAERSARPGNPTTSRESVREAGPGTGTKGELHA